MSHVRNRIALTMPELDHFGIHVMASQMSTGELILGDSHQYGVDIDPFNQEQIDHLVLREIKKVLIPENLEVTHRWSGIYASHPKEMFFVSEVLPDVKVVNGFGGNGMTLALAVSEEIIESWDGAPVGKKSMSHYRVQGTVSITP